MPRDRALTRSTSSELTASTTSAPASNVAVDDGCSGIAVGLVESVRASPGASLHAHVNTQCREASNALRHESDPAFAGSRLCRYCDSGHVRHPMTTRGGESWKKPVPVEQPAASVQHLEQLVDGEVEVVLLDHQRWRQPDGGLVGVLGQDAVDHQPLAA